MKMVLRETVDGQLFHYKRWRGDLIHWHYELIESHTFISKLAFGGLFSNERLFIVKTPEGDVSITLTRKTKWNGATCAPDFPKVVRGTAFHDTLYDCKEEIAAAWGWSVCDVRRWADDVFNEVNKAEGFWRAVKRIYYRAVRWLGGLFR